MFTYLHTTMASRDLLVIARECNKTLNGLIKRMAQKFKSLPNSADDVLFIETLQRRVWLATSTDETFIIREASDHVAKYSERLIENDNLDWLINELDTIAIDVDVAEKNMFETLINVITRRYSSMSESEKKTIYANVKTIHDDCLEFGL